MNYVSMQIHRFSRESLAMVVLGDFSTLCTHFLAARCASLYFDGGCAKESRNFPLVGWVFHFSILERNYWIGFSGKRKAIRQKVLCEFYTIFCSAFFQIRAAKLFWKRRWSLSWGWIILKVPEGDESDHPSSNGRHHLKNQRENAKNWERKIKVPFLQKRDRLPHFFWIIDEQRRKKSEALRLELNLCSSISTPKWSRIVAQLALNMSFASSTLSFL